MTRQNLLPLAPLVAGAVLFLTDCGNAAPPATKAEAPAADTAPGSEMPDAVTLGSAAIAEAGIATWTAQTVDLEHLLVLNGTVEHDENHFVQLASNVRGRVSSIPVDLGARVRPGDAVIVIESLELARAKEEFIKETASLRVAAKVYERAKALLAGKGISASEFQAREGDYQARRATAQAAERALRLYGEGPEEIDRLRRSLDSEDVVTFDGPQVTIRAPFAGQIVDRRVTSGTQIESLQPLVTLADIASVWVFMQAYEKDLALLRKGLAVTIRADAYPQEAFHGRVDFLGSTVDPATRTVRVRATVMNPQEKLRPGMFIKAQVDVPRPAGETAGILAVPQSAFQTLDGRTTIFLQVKPGVFVRRPVETGHTFEGFTEVLAGVKIGDVVVTEGSFVLKSEFAKASLAESE